MTTYEALLAWGDAVKALGEEGKVGGYLIRFGSPDDTDFYGTYFTAGAYYGPRDGDGADALVHHGFPVARGLEALADTLLPPLRTKKNDVGVWAEIVLDMANEYQRQVYELVKAGKLAWSSGSAAHMVRYAEDGKGITRWPIIEGSLTPTPAQPFYTRIQPVRSLSNELNERYTPMVVQPVVTEGGFVTPHSESADRHAQDSAAFRSYMVRGVKPRRDMETGEPTEGGLLVPQSYSNSIVVPLQEGSVLRRAGARIERISGVKEFRIPKLVGTGAAVLTREEGAYDEQTPALGEITFAPYKFTRLTKASEELLSDSRVDVVERILAPDAGRAFSQAENEYFVTGTGAGEPQGIMTALDSANQVTALSATAIQYDDLVDVMHAIGIMYRDGASWLISDSAVKALRKLKDGDGRPVWEPSLQAGQPDLLLGRPVYTSALLPDVATGETPVLFGDFSYYWIVEFSSIAVQRLDQLYAVNGQVGFRWYRRLDARVVDTDAFSYLTMA
jgi:HK97 family phage major capsid protein